MFKKFILYFAVFFVAIFLLLNFSSITAEFRYWLDSPGEVQANQMTETASQIATQSTPVISSIKSRPTVSINPAAGLEISIPKIGITAPVIIEPSADPKVILKDLKKGVVHYSGSAMLGQPGTAIILGHSWTTSWRTGNYDSVFSLINKLAAGDTFTISNGDNVLTYRVVGNMVFNPISKDKTIEEFIKSDSSSLVLITCWPAGSSRERLAVKADLVQ
jgi:LPXTG-site transpeptidase (sortase) family protein